MKKQDLIFVACAIALFLPFFLFDELYNAYRAFNKEHGIVMSVFKFGILATAGEMLGLRIREGVYNRANFGLAPRAILWGIYGVIIAIAFKAFYGGSPYVCEYLGIERAAEVLAGPVSMKSVVVSFSIAALLNLIFSPVFMTLHKVTDTHVVDHDGRVSCLAKPVDVAGILKKLDWDMQWHFIFKKTIPFFWIPMHTAVFLLPVDMQILAAALLGVVLGAILGFAARGRYKPDDMAVPSCVDAG